MFFLFVRVLSIADQQHHSEVGTPSVNMPLTSRLRLTRSFRIKKNQGMRYAHVPEPRAPWPQKSSYRKCRTQIFLNRIGSDNSSERAKPRSSFVQRAERIVVKGRVQRSLPKNTPRLPATWLQKQTTTNGTCVSSRRTSDLLFQPVRRDVAHSKGSYPAVCEPKKGKPNEIRTGSQVSRDRDPFCSRLQEGAPDPEETTEC